MKKIITFLIPLLLMFSFNAFAINVLALPDEYVNYVEEVNGQICIIQPREDLAIVDGVLFNKKEKVLLRYSEGKTDRSYSIPDGIKAIDDSAFWGNKYLEEITIPESVEVIHGSAFSCCENLNTVNICEGVTQIENHAFIQCYKLESIAIPDSVCDIGKNIFAHTGIKQVELSQNSPFETINNSLISKDDRVLLSYFGDDKEYQIPYGVNTINSDSFINKSVEEVIIPESVTSIKSGAFFMCKQLQNVIFPDNDIAIERNAFKLCDNVILKSNNPYIKNYAIENNLSYSMKDDDSWLN